MRVALDKGHVTTRYYGWYANRPRGMRRQAEPVALEAPPVILPAPRLAPTEAARRWAALLQQIFEVDPLACPTCRGPMRILAFITQTAVIDQILTHLRARPALATHAGARWWCVTLPSIEPMIGKSQTASRTPKETLHRCAA